MREIDALAIEIWECGKPVTWPGYIYTAIGLRPGQQCRIDLSDQNHAAWAWRLLISDLVELDDQESPGAGWVGANVMVLGIDGSTYGPQRPFHLYTQPWIHPTLWAWPDAYHGPLVVTVRVPGRLDEKVQ